MPKIIVVDDNGATRMSAARVLTTAGYEVVTMPDAESAFSAIVSDSFDLVLSDIVMPGVDGLQLLIRIRNRYPYARVVMMTGTHHDSKIREGASLLGACDFLTKPFSQEELLAVIRNALEGEAALELPA